MKSLNDYYTIYSTARAIAWNVYDREHLTSPEKRDASPTFQKALRAERRAWDAYQEAWDRELAKKNATA